MTTVDLNPKGKPLGLGTQLNSPEGKPLGLSLRASQKTEPMSESFLEEAQEVGAQTARRWHLLLAFV